MGIKDAVAQQVLKVLDNTLGKKWKVIDKITDWFQGAEHRMLKIEEHQKRTDERLDKLEANND